MAAATAVARPETACIGFIRLMPQLLQPFFFHFNLENVIFSRLRKGQYGGYHCTALVFVLLSFNFLFTLR